MTKKISRIQRGIDGLPGYKGRIGRIVEGEKSRDILD